MWQGGNHFQFIGEGVVLYRNMIQDNTVTVQGSGIWQQVSTVTTSRLTLWGIINVERNCGIPCSPVIQEAEMEKGRA